MDPISARIGELKVKFPFGRIVATPGALAELSNEEIQSALWRHVQGDWESMDREDRDANDDALKNGGRLFSRYSSTQNIVFWIITEADRSATTVLLPEDY